MVAPVKLSPSRNGSGANPAPKTETEVTAEVVQTALRSRFNPIRGLTPRLLSAQLDQFYLGYIAYAAMLWDAIERRDDVLKGVAAKRKKDVSRLDWEIKTVDGADDATAKLHKEALEEFYNNLTAVNALDENERGGFALLVRQMMDAVGKYYAVHEIVWKPGAVLTAELRFVPLWFFENRTGRLQFMRIPLGGIEGDPLEEGGWMITKGDGLMEACSVAYMFKNLPLKDWLAYSDKFGTPGILGRTNAGKGSDAGNAMSAAVRDFGQNWSATIFGDDGAIKDPITLVQAKGEGTLPFPPLIERMDRAMASLWRGADLSSMSGTKAHNQGASVQGDESDILLFDDAATISEALNIYIDRWVLWQKFGVGDPTGSGVSNGRGLAYIEIVAPEEKDIDRDLKIDELLLNSGARLGEKERLEYYGRPEIDDTDTPLHAPTHIAERITEQAAVTGQTEAAQAGTLGAPAPKDPAKPKTPVTTTRTTGPETISNAFDPDLENFLGPHRGEFLVAFANDLQPLRAAMEKSIEGLNETAQRSRLRVLRARLPQVLTQIAGADLDQVITDAMKP